MLANELVWLANQVCSWLTPRMTNVWPLASTMLRPLMCSPTAADAGWVYTRIVPTTAIKAAANAMSCRFKRDLPPSGRHGKCQSASINTRNQQRDEHLRHNDFLAVDEHPAITFVSTGLQVTGDDTFELAGDLAIRGVTNAITIPFTFEGAATDPFGNVRLGFAGSVAINRKDYGVTWNAALETGGFLVSDKVVLEFEVSAIKTA